MDIKETNKVFINKIMKLQNDEVENFVNEAVIDPLIEFRLPQYYKDNMKKIRAKLARGEIKGDWYRRLFDSLTDEQKKQIASGSLAGRRILVKFGFDDDYYGGKAMQDILIAKIAKDISESKKAVVRGKTGSYSIPSPRNVFVGEYGKREGLDRGKILGYMDDNGIKLNKTNLRKMYKNDDLARELGIPYGYFQGAINQLIDDLMGLKDYKRELAKVEKQIDAFVRKTYKQGRISKGRYAAQSQKSEYLHNKASVLRDKIKDIEQAQKSKKIKIRTPDKPKKKSLQKSVIRNPKDMSDKEIDAEMNSIMDPAEKKAKESQGISWTTGFDYLEKPELERYEALRLEKIRRNPTWKRREDAKARAMAKREARRKAAEKEKKTSVSKTSPKSSLDDKELRISIWKRIPRSNKGGKAQNKTRQIVLYPKVRKALGKMGFDSSIELFNIDTASRENLIKVAKALGLKV